MIIALIECDNIGGLAKDIDLQTNRHAQRHYVRLHPVESPGTLGTQLSQQLTIIGTKCAKIYADLWQTMDVVANTGVEKVFGTTSLDAVLDIQSDILKPLADATPNTKLAQRPAGVGLNKAISLRVFAPSLARTVINSLGE